MARVRICLSILTLAATSIKGQQSPRPDDVLKVGHDVKAPRVLHQVEPEYSPSARADHVQGTVIVELIVDEKGRPVEIKVLSPLGYGLDELALAAVEKWEFVPGTKNGKPVRTLATIEIKFRFPDIWFDEKAERHRTTFNFAVNDLNKANAKESEVNRAVKDIQELSRQKFPAAMYLVGAWEAKGDRLALNEEDGLALIQKAASKNYGPALYEIALRRIQGRGLPQDVEKGLKEMRDAGLMGSPQAQFFLGDRYEHGNGVPREPDRARRYFRLCATKGNGVCQFRLASLLFSAPDRPERDYVQAIALFQLAGERGVQAAKEIALRETALLTPTQATWVNTLKSQLVRK